MKLVLVFSIFAGLLLTASCTPTLAESPSAYSLPSGEEIYFSCRGSMPRPLLDHRRRFQAGLAAFSVTDTVVPSPSWLATLILP
jgi:hypothetical protein